MVNIYSTTEEKIIAAAREVFIQKGMDGSRMQEIADRAEINKALLHYYFRNKDKLFTKVFEDVFSNVLEMFERIFSTETESLDAFIELFVTNYINLIRQKPFIVQFVLHELNQNPERVAGFIRSSKIDPGKIIALISKEPENSALQLLDPIHVMVNIMSMCIFPFLARPIIKEVLLSGSDEEFESFLDIRAGQVLAFVRLAIFNNNNPTP